MSSNAPIPGLHHFQTAQIEAPDGRRQTVAFCHACTLLAPVGMHRLQPCEPLQRISSVA